jgi:hypothetical protein
MAVNAAPTYVNQVLEERYALCLTFFYWLRQLTIARYIKVVVLEEFLDNNVEEFGTERSIEVGADLL